MLKTNSGLIIVVKNIVNNNNMLIDMYKNITFYNAYNTANYTGKEFPTSYTINVMDEFTKLLSNTTSLGGKSMAEMNNILSEKAVMNALNMKASLLPRPDFETLGITVVV